MKKLSFIIPIQVDAEDMIDKYPTALRILQLHSPLSERSLVKQDAKTQADHISGIFPTVLRHLEFNADQFADHWNHIFPLKFSNAE